MKSSYDGKITHFITVVISGYVINVKDPKRTRRKTKFYPASIKYIFENKFTPNYLQRNKLGTRESTAILNYVELWA